MGLVINQTKLPVLTALAGAILLASLGISIATVALPSLVLAFSTSVAAVQWVVLAYLISATVAIVSVGRLGDLFGHRRVLVIGLALFTLASFLCAVAQSLGVLIVARGIQGMGGAILMALPVAMVRERVEKGQIGSAMGLFGTMSALGTALGPSMGGLLMTYFGWQAAFILLAGFAFCMLMLTLWVIPADRSQTTVATRSLDWPGTGLLAMTLMLYALATLGSKVGLGLDSGLLLGLGILTLIAFIAVESRTASPLVSIDLLRERTTGTLLASNLLVTTLMMSTLIVGPFFLSFALGLNVALTGLVMAVGPITATLFGVPAGRMTDRFGVRRTLMIGLVQTLFGLVCLAFLPIWLGVAGYAVALMLLTPGFQLFFAANGTAVMLGATDEQRGMLSGLLGLSRNLGFMTGASVMPALFAVALGSQEIASSSPQEVANAFTATFLAAAGLCVVAIAVTIWANWHQNQ